MDGSLGFGLLVLIALIGYAVTTWLRTRNNKPRIDMDKKFANKKDTMEDKLNVPNTQDVRRLILNVGDIIHHGITNPVPQRCAPILESLGNMIRNYDVAPAAAYRDLWRALDRSDVDRAAAKDFRGIVKGVLRGERPAWNLLLLCNQMCDRDPEQAIEVTFRIVSREGGRHEQKTPSRRHT